MKSLRLTWLLYIILALLAVIFSGRATVLSESAVKREKVCINWAFGALIGPENNRELISIKNKTALKTDDRFKMMVELKSNCFVYLIYHGSNGEIQMLFPKDFNELKKSHNLFQRYYIPQKDLWFALDEHVGKETFYLLVSKTRLAELENLFKKHESSSSQKKPDAVAQIIKEIKKIKRQHKKLTAKAERPVTLGGNVRGIKDKQLSTHDVASLAVEISATDFYSRTFTIEHK